MSAAAVPLGLGPADRPIFAWLHPAAGAGAPSGIGLVICNPFGYEAICAHRSLRHFAVAAAAAGFPALRFDYDGTGDSGGHDGDPERVPAWLASIHAAADGLRRHAGVDKIVFLGVRLGALLAASAATTRTDVAGLIAIAPVVSGRLYVRELKALQVALGLAPAPAGAAAAVPDMQEAVGFRLGAETRDALGKLDLLRLPRPPAQRVLVLDRADLPGADKWTASLEAAGVAVVAHKVPGYVEMVLDPHRAVVPAVMRDALVDWLGTLPDGETAAASTAAPAPPAVLTHGDLVETARFIGRDVPLFGIVTEARTPPGRRQAILILNSGGIHRVGPNRLYVDLARRLAARGHLVLRLDIAGIGDSAPRRGHEENVVYTARAVDDVAAALDFLRAQPGVTSCVALGLCSGAYHAFKAAVRGLPLDAIVPINPLTFFWKEGMSLDYAPHKVTEEAQRYADAVRDPDKWRKLLRGEVKLNAVAQIVGRRALAFVESGARDVARRLGRPFPDDLGSELETVARRGIDVRFVFAASDPGLELLHLQGGSSVPRLAAEGKVGWDIIDGPDHTFTPLWSHAVLLDRLVAILDGRSS